MSLCSRNGFATFCLESALLTTHCWLFALLIIISYNPPLGFFFPPRLRLFWIYFEQILRDSSLVMDFGILSDMPC